MLMPTLSVTVVGVLAALVVLLRRRTLPARRLGLGVLGAWVGFAAGGLVGIVVDVVAGTGNALAVAGHSVAVIGAFASAAAAERPLVRRARAEQSPR